MSESRKPLAVGIDLGTTYSVIAHLDTAGRPTTILNREGELTTPSVVLFEGDHAVAGKEALKAMAGEAEHVADLAKRELGRRSYRRPINGRDYPPEVIQAIVLRKLKSDAELKLGEIRQAVITVPAYFDEVRRKATQDAGYLAGFDVLDIINEPTAAAVAFGYQEGLLNSSSDASGSRKIMVYDLGGGTFDVTVMEIAGSKFHALSTDGDVQLGGRDWDQRLFDYVAGEFVLEHGLDPREDVSAAGRLWRECEDAKRTLSARPKVSIHFDFRGLAVRCDITRQEFADLTQDLLDRTRFTAKQALQAAGLRWADLERVLLVGGSTRMPMVHEMLRELSGKPPDTSASADEAVAHGAALHAGLILAKQQNERPTFQIRNVNSHSLGVVAIDRDTRKPRTALLIPRNTPLPVKAKRAFKTHKPNQKSIFVQIIEGENADPGECLQLGQCVVRDLPPGLPQGTPIEVRFRYAENGRLTVTVRVEGMDMELHHEIARENSLSRGQLDHWRTFVEKASM